VTLPNFVIIGAIKGGTTSLYRYLGEHPDVYMCPRKEPLYFAWDPERPRPAGQQEMCTDLGTYESLFEGAAGAPAVGEASPQYLYSVVAAGRIRETIPDARLIAILRHPVERALSAYLHLVRDGAETLTFEGALAAEDERRREGWDPIWHYRAVGLYADQVERYCETFDRDQVRFYLHDDFERDPRALVQDVFGFLDVDPSFEPATSVRFNASGVPRRRLLFRLATTENPMRRAARAAVPQRHRERLRVLAINRSLERPQLAPETRRRLAQSFTDDVRRLQRLLGRDLSHWLR